MYVLYMEFLYLVRLSLASTIYNRHLEAQEFANCQMWVQGSEFSRESNDLRDNHNYAKPCINNTAYTYGPPEKELCTWNIPQ